MAFLTAPRSQLLLGPNIVILILVTIITFVAAVDSTTKATPIIEVYPPCKKTPMPKRCSVQLSALIKSMAEAKEAMAGPQLEAGRIKNDSCIMQCAKDVDAVASSATAAKADGDAMSQLNKDLDRLVIHSEEPTLPCDCACPAAVGSSSCSADEAAAVKKLGAAGEAMNAMGSLIQKMIDFDQQEDGGKAEATMLEKSMDSGVLHVSCGFTKQPQRCSDELSVVKTASEAARTAAWEVQEFSAVKPAPALNSVITECDDAIRNLNKQLTSAEYEASNLTALGASIHALVQGPSPRCKYSCPPPPPEKPCAANETVVVDKMNGVYNAWVSADKFLAQEI